MASHGGVLRDERGFSLIELLVVVLLVGVLAAIAIPAFLNQKSKAYDSTAKALAHDVQVAAESYATDNAGSYANLTVAALGQIDGTIQTAAGNGNPYVASVTNATATGYTVTIKPAAGNETFTIARSGGSVSRTCTVNGVSGTGGGCAAGSW